MLWRNLLDIIVNKKEKQQKITNISNKKSYYIYINSSSGDKIAVVVNIKSNSKKMILKIDFKTNKPVVTSPPFIPQSKIENFIFQHRDWIEANLSTKISVKFVEGTEIPLRGNLYKITHSEIFRGETQIISDNDKNILLVHGAKEQISNRVKRFLIKEAEQDFNKAVAHYANILNVSYGSITLRDTKSRWGSCSSKGDLSFSWRLIFAPSFVLEYLAAHEISHRVEMNHSIKYWKVVSKIFPDFKKAENWLKIEGKSLYKYG